MERFVPPLVVDVVWLGTEKWHDDVMPVAMGIFEMLHRDLGLKRDASGRPILDEREVADTKYWTGFASVRDVDVPVFIGRDLSDVKADVDSVRDVPGALRIVVPLWPGMPVSHADDDVKRFEHRLEEIKLAGAVILSVPLTREWRDAGLADLPLQNHLYPPDHPERMPPQESIEEGLAVEIVNRLGQRHIRVFISHAKADLDATEQLATEMLTHLTNHHRLSTFFDAQDLSRGDELDEQLLEGIKGSVLLCIVGDTFADSPYCQFEVLAAKREGGPMVSVSALRDGERRSLAFGANHYRIPWRLGLSEAERGRELNRIARLCLRTQLRHLHFRRVADAVLRSRRHVGRAKIISRPPEPVDLATNLIRRDASVTVLYPDPPIGRQEAGLLRSANPRCRLVTPSTLQTTAVIDPHGPDDLPLRSLRIAFSVSDAVDDAPDISRAPSSRGTGMFKCHLDEAIAHAALTIIRLGARIGYGGHLAKGGFTELLSLLMARHNRVANQRDRIYAYVVPIVQSWVREQDQVPQVSRVDMSIEPFPGNNAGEVEVGWQCTQMRAFMANHVVDPGLADGFERSLSRAKECHARVCIGGNRSPKEVVSGPGYNGPFPGAVEESWWMVASPDRRHDPKPLYVLGGFGGVSRDLAACLDPDADLPESMKEVTWRGNARFQRIRRDYQAYATRRDWGVPASLDQMAAELRDYGRKLRAGEVSNGLTWEENQVLWSTTSPIEAATLLAKGLIVWQRRQVKDGGLRIGVRRGDARFETADALGLASLEGLTPDQLEGLDQLVLSVSGLTEQERHRGPTSGEVRVFGLPSTMAARYGVWSSLGRVADLTQRGAEHLTSAVRGASRQLVRGVVSHDLRSLVVVPFAGNLNLPVEEATRAIVLGALEAHGAADHEGRRLERLTLCERDPSRYRDVLRGLAALVEEGHPIVIDELPPQPGVLERDSPLVLRVTGGEDGRLDVELDLPERAAPHKFESHAVDWAEIEAILHAVRETPYADLHRLGLRLQKALMPAPMQAMLGEGARPIEVRHDSVAGKIPFELIRFGAPEEGGKSAGEDRFAWLAMRGLSRRPLQLAPSGHLARKPHDVGAIRVLLVVNPTNDLPGAEREQRRLVDLLESRHRVRLEVLAGADATRENVLNELGKRFDVMHYAGHAFLDPARPAHSGLVLANREILVASDLAGLPEGFIPQIVFLNACESARDVLMSGRPVAETKPDTVAEQ
ncbi:MAG: CHAT domain-containing protein, partial [Myxococcota bacterium]